MQLSAKQSAALKLVLTAVTLILLFLFLRGRKDLSPEAILSAVRQVGLPNAVLVVLLAMTQIFFMVLRMYALCPSRPRASFRDVTYATAVGHSVNMFFPARAGEALKVLWLGRSVGMDEGYVARGAGWVLADRVVDLAGFFTVILLSGVLTLPAFKTVVPFSLWWFPAGAAGIFGIAVVVNAYSSKVHAKFQTWMTKLHEGFSGVRDPLGVSLGWLAGIGSWLVEIVALEILATSQGYTLQLSEAFFVLVVLNLAIAVPISVANVGTFEASMAFALKFFGVPLSTSIAIAGIHHLLQLFGVAGCALLALAWSRGKSPKLASTTSGPSA